VLGAAADDDDDNLYSALAVTLSAPAGCFTAIARPTIARLCSMACSRQT
jgi:hypothetical protein